MKISELVKNNIFEVKQFFMERLTYYKLPNNDDTKILVDCVDYGCDKGRHQHKAIINISWNLFYCYKCGKSLSLYNYCKELGIEKDFIQFLSTLSNHTLEEIKKQLVDEHNTTNNEITNIKKENKTESEIDKFKRENYLFDIEEITEAKRYALNRVNGDEEIIKGWLCDNLYIYIPVVFNGKIISYIGRCYIEDFPCMRYNTKTLDKSSVLCYNYDSVVNNFNTNEIYLVEGLFDAIAVNQALNNNCCIALLGKSHYKEIIKMLSEELPGNTVINICLDSIEKDNDIVKDNLKIADYANQFFSNIFIVNLEYGDCADIGNKSLFELSQQLINNKFNTIDYKCKILLG